MNDLLRGGLALVAIVIVALALSGTDTGAKFVQFGIVVAIIVLLFRQQQNTPQGQLSPIFNAWNNVTRVALQTTGKQTSS